jgi:hypothetical protein
MRRRIFSLCLVLAAWSSLALADQRVSVPLAAGEDRAAAVERAFDEALGLEVRAIAGPSLTDGRLQAVMDVLARERDALVLGYREGVPAASTVPGEGGNATAENLTLDVRVDGAGLKARLRELGVLSTLSGPLPYELRLSGVEPSRTKRLGALQQLSGLQPVPVAGEGVPVLTLSQAGAWTGSLSVGEWRVAKTAKTLDEVWLAVWKEYFSRPAALSAGGTGLVVRVSGWLSSMGPMEFDGLMAGWAAEVDHKTLVGVEMDGPGMVGVWQVQTRSREALVRRLQDAAKAQGLTVEIR